MRKRVEEWEIVLSLGVLTSGFMVDEGMKAAEERLQRMEVAGEMCKIHSSTTRQQKHDY